MSLLKVVLHPDKIVKYGLNVKQAVVLDLILKQCDRNKAENIMGLTFFKISNDKLLEDTEFLNIKKRMLIMIINELEKLDFSRMDFSEFINEVVPKDINVEQRKQTIENKVKASFSQGINYYE